MLTSAAQHQRCLSLGRCLSTSCSLERNKPIYFRPSAFRGGESLQAGKPFVQPLKVYSNGTDKPPTLIEELFPLETNKGRRATEARPKPRRDIPVKPLQIGFEPSEDLFGPSENLFDLPQTRESQEAPPARAKEGRRWRYDQSAVLFLRKAGKHLTEEDFRRAQPTGRHIEGWTSSGDEMKVIRGRDLETMSPNGDYFILFKDARAANSYQQNARRLHQLSQTYTPAAGDLRGPIPPPPVLDALRPTPSGHGDSAPAPATHDEIASYTLLPPSQAVYIRHVQSPLAPIMREVLELGGYEPLMRDRRADVEVLLRVDGWQPTLQSVRGAINDDGHGRHLHWDIAGRSNGVREVLLPRQNARKPYQARSENAEAGTTDAAAADEEEPVMKAWKIWIVSFWKEEEAQRFVATWHRRDVAPLLRLRGAYTLPEDEEVVMNAEVIW